jgi:hypothetical protein
MIARTARSIMLVVIVGLSIGQGEALLHARIGNCTKPRIVHPQSKCGNLVYIEKLGAKCVPLRSPFQCSNGLTATHARWISTYPTGTCESISVYGFCSECTGHLICAEGDGYEDDECLFFACPMASTSGPNRCISS